MDRLTTELADTTVVSVGHRPELEAFHSRKIVLERRRGGAEFVTDIQLIRKPRGRLIRNWLRGRQRSTTPGERDRLGSSNPPCCRIFPAAACGSRSEHRVGSKAGVPSSRVATAASDGQWPSPTPARAPISSLPA